MKVDLNHIMRSLDQFGVIINSVSIGMGVFFILTGFFKLKRYGEMRTYMSQQMTVLGPLMFLFVGSALLMLPDVIDLFSSAILIGNNPLAPDNSGGSSEVIKTVKMMVRTLGVVGFIRGLVGLSGAGSQSQPGKVTKSLMFIVGGVMCIHIYAMISLLKNIVSG